MHVISGHWAAFDYDYFTCAIGEQVVIFKINAYIHTFNIMYKVLFYLTPKYHKDNKIQTESV